MNRNPIIPFILIMVFGIGLVFFLSMHGVNNGEEAKGDEKAAEGGEQAAAGGEFDPEGFYAQTCIGCHGQNYEGGVGPSLKGVGDRHSKEDIVGILQNGLPGGMPAGLVPAENQEAMAEWLSTLK